MQFRGIKSNDPMQFKSVETQAVASPLAYASGEPIYPFEKARQVQLRRPSTDE